MQLVDVAGTGHMTRAVSLD